MYPEDDGSEVGCRNAMNAEMGCRNAMNADGQQDLESKTSALAHDYIISSGVVADAVAAAAKAASTQLEALKMLIADTHDQKPGVRQTAMADFGQINLASQERHAQHSKMLSMMPGPVPKRTQESNGVKPRVRQGPFEALLNPCDTAITPLTTDSQMRPMQLSDSMRTQQDNSMHTETAQQGVEMLQGMLQGKTAAVAAYVRMLSEQPAEVLDDLSKSFFADLGPGHRSHNGQQSYEQRSESSGSSGYGSVQHGSSHNGQQSYEQRSESSGSSGYGGVPMEHTISDRDLAMLSSLIDNSSSRLQGAQGCPGLGLSGWMAQDQISQNCMAPKIAFLPYPQQTQNFNMVQMLPQGPSAPNVDQNQVQGTMPLAMAYINGTPMVAYTMQDELYED
jgi:hypothetical protein